VKTENKSNTPKEIRDLWRTPRELFWNLHSEFYFVCDVAASADNRLCSWYFTEEQNALVVEWKSSNWCNPPYSNIGPWVDKAIEQHALGKTIVMLLPSDTSVRWFRAAYRSCNEVRFISGRLSFINEETGKPVRGNNKGSVLFIWNAFDKSHAVKLIDRKDLLKPLDTAG
jgi:phage N-6-adenine-methyltransferase